MGAYRLCCCGSFVVFLAWFVHECVNGLSRTLLGYERELYPIEWWVLQYDEDAVDMDIPVFDCHHHAGSTDTWEKNWLHDLHWITVKWWNMLRPIVQNYYVNLDPNATEISGWRSSMILPYNGEEILADMRGPNGRGHNVVGSIFVEAGWISRGVDQKCMEPVREADAAAEIHRQHPQIVNGIIAFANLSLGAEVEPALQYYKKNSLVVGIRHSLAYAESIGGAVQDEKAGYDPKFREGFALLSKYGFTFDSWIFHPQVDVLADLARAFPDTTIVADHIGKPLGFRGYDREESRRVWEPAMRRLAGHRNVYVKIGALGMRHFGFGFDERPKPPTSDELAAAWGPYVLFVIETFGVDRCLMESNFPVDKVSCSYTVLFNALKKITRGYSKEDRRKMFELNARRVYKVFE